MKWSLWACVAREPASSGLWIGASGLAHHDWRIGIGLHDVAASLGGLMADVRSGGWRFAKAKRRALRGCVGVGVLTGTLRACLCASWLCGCGGSDGNLACLRVRSEKVSLAVKTIGAVKNGVISTKISSID